MITRRFSVALPVDAARAFAWHAQPGALPRLLPPWDRVRVRSRTGSLADGQVVLELSQGPLTLTWDARHDPSRYEADRQFVDTQASGPFAYWSHVHRIETGVGSRESGIGSRESGIGRRELGVGSGESGVADPTASCTLTDEVTWRLPLDPLSWPARPMVERVLRRMFAYRHWVTRADLSRHGQGPAMRIAITGATGLVGSALVPFLQGGGHDVVRLVRGTPRQGEHQWSPERGLVDPDRLGAVDAVIHLAGENVAGGRWTPAFKAKIRDSRVGPTQALARSLAALPVKPRVFISASAIGYYGNRGTEDLTEQSAPGQGFLADVCQEWEAAADPARAAGIRVVHPRFGIILDARGGALGKMRLPFSLGVGGRLASGEQYYSWVGMEDVLGSILFALTHDTIVGPMNVTSPHPVTNAEFTRTLGRVLHRPTIFPVPGFVLTTLFGEMAEAELLSSKRVLPAALTTAGYVFSHPRLEDALRFTLGRVEATPVA
ncbi:hypothetical protein TBR22_A05620 [Luteitalea sp. TBR-22]|uniref:TIGR01777 family oxidoreductase n=1 Tax=Luteitalea sp. TBR-22 TaxID=2802971 RepID=UPI001AFA051F|nr:TIGR01777 family oxidoreductase [Luteitalea sp. TBR-22]BCS31362.1 hypothetical protein TBR22_A05620 [Luteitalea sp. TBR-22]